MNTITSIFEQAQLAEAAYADFSNPNISHLAALQAEKFSSAQATEFLNNWRVVDHVPNLNSGFTATLFDDQLWRAAA